MRFFSINQRGEHQGDLEREWWEQYKRVYRCPGCRQEKKDQLSCPVNVLLEYAPTPGGLLMGMGFLDAWLARRDFIERFADVAKGYLVFGTVHDAAGNHYPEYVTYRAPFILPLRGTEESILGYCSICKRIRYMPRPYGRYYICAKDLIPGRLFYTHSFVPLIVGEPLLDRLDLKIRKRLKIKEILVKDEAEDGLDRFPEPYF